MNLVLEFEIEEFFVKKKRKEKWARLNPCSSFSKWITSLDNNYMLVRGAEAGWGQA